MPAKENVSPDVSGNADEGKMGDDGAGNRSRSNTDDMNIGDGKKAGSPMKGEDVMNDTSNSMDATGSNFNSSKHPLV